MERSVVHLLWRATPLVMTHQKSRIHQSLSLCEVTYRLLDVLGILLGLALAVRLQIGVVTELYLLSGAAATIIFYLLCEISGMYRNWRGVSFDREVLCAGATWTVTMPILLSLSVMVRYAQWVDRSFVLTWFALTLLLIVLCRAIVRCILHSFRSRGYNTRGFAIVGVNSLGVELARRINRRSGAGPESRGIL